MKKLILLLFLPFFPWITTHAAFIRDIPRAMVQPDGDTLHCFMSGDEFYQWFHDARGYTIMQDTSSGFFVYAIQENGKLSPSAHVAGRVDPDKAGLRPYLNIAACEWQEKRENSPYSLLPEAKAKSKKTLSNFYNLVIFIRFADDMDFTESFSTINSMFNDSTNGAISIYNYYKATSYGQLTVNSFFSPEPENDKIISYQDIYPKGYYQPYSITNPNGYQDGGYAREVQLLSNALNFVKDKVPAQVPLDGDNDEVIDNIIFIVKGDVGEWLELLWPHKSRLRDKNIYINGKKADNYNFHLSGSTTYFNTGVLCHELFHSFGAPDLYHYDDKYRALSPVGEWDIMEKTGNPPQQPCAYMKYEYGQWIDEIPAITKPGKYTLYPLNSEQNTKVCYKIPTSNDKEYYVIEYRKRSLYENTPSSGIVFFRINENYNGNTNYNGTSRFDELYLFRQGGKPNVNGDPYLANFHERSMRNEFGPDRNPYPFLTNGTLSEFIVYDISTTGDSMTFRYASSVDSMWMEDNIPEYVENEKITIYPNPVTHECTVRIQDPTTPIEEIGLYDIYGRLIFTRKISAGQTKIDCSSLSPGMYVVKVLDNKKIIHMTKIMKI